jgi:hypothetical protein
MPRLAAKLQGDGGNGTVTFFVARKKNFFIFRAFSLDRWGSFKYILDFESYVLHPTNPFEQGG